MNDNSSSFSSLSLFKNSIKKIPRKEIKQNILNDELRGVSNQTFLLKKADLNLQNVLSTILINCNDEDKNNYNINDTLKQIRNVKKIIPVYHSSSSDDSDLSPGTRKHGHSVGQMIDSPRSLLKNFRISWFSPAKKISKHSNDFNIINKQSFDDLTSSTALFDKGKIKKARSFLYKQNEIHKTKGDSIDDKDIINSIDEGNHIIKRRKSVGLYMSSNSIHNLNKIKEEIYDNINLRPKKSRDTTKRISLHKTEYAENNQNSHRYSNKNQSFSELSSAADSVFRSHRENEFSPFRCLLKRGNLVYDSLSEKEESQVEYYYIEPNNSFIFIFDMILAVLSLLSFIHLPFEIAFIHQATQGTLFFNFIFNTIIDLLYLIDIIIAVFKGYYDLEEHFIFKNNDICFHYFKGWFILDFIAAIPLNFLLDYILIFYPKSKFTQATLQIYSNDEYTLVHLFRLFRLIKGFKIIFNNLFMKYLKKNCFDSMMESKWALINISLLFFFASVNLFGCIFIFLGYNHFPNWFELKELEPYDVLGIYIASIYFILMTIVSIGYGDISSANMSERIFNVFLLIFGIMLYSWAISTISKQIEDTNEKAIEYNQKLKLLEQIKLSHKKFPPLLNEKIQRYLYYNYEHDQSNVEIILNQLPGILRNALIYNMYRPILENFTFFKSFANNNFCVRVLIAFKPIVYLKNERLIHEGDYLEEMFFVKKGILSLELLIPSVLNEELEKTFSLNRAFSSTMSTIDVEKKIRSKFSMKSNLHIFKEKPKPVYTGYDEKYVKLIYIRANEHFGDIMMFLNQKCPLTVRVKTKKAEVFLLKKTDAIGISMNFPKIWRRIIRKSIFNFEQINCLIRKTLRFFFIQNRVCFNQLMKKYYHCPKITNVSNQFFNANGNNKNCNSYNQFDPNINYELASIPTMNSKSSSANGNNTNPHASMNKEMMITGMMKPEDDIGNFKLSESSTSNLLSHPNNRNEQKIEPLGKSKQILENLHSSFILNDNSSRKNGQNKSNSSFRKNTSKDEAKSAKFMSERLNEFDFSIANAMKKTKISNNRTIDSLKAQEINNEFYDDESLYSSNKYVYNVIDWDNFYDKKIIKDIFNQKPENEISNLFKSVPAFKSLAIDKRDNYEYNPNLFYYTVIQDPETENEEENSLNINNIKIAINVISSNAEEKKDKGKEPIHIPLRDNKNILKWNNTINDPLTKDDNCSSFRSNKSARSARSILSNHSNRSKRSDRSEPNTSNRPDQHENEGIKRIFTAKHNAVNIFRKKAQKGSLKEKPMKSRRGENDSPSLMSINNSNSNRNNMKSNSTLLQVIGENIHSNSMNLNNPASFYSSTFANMIDMHKIKGDLLKINKKMNNILSMIKNNE